MYPKNVLDDILVGQSIKTVFQPIVSLENGSILGYEALSRITVPNCEVNIEELFGIAFEYNKLWELEQLCRVRALESAAAQSTNEILFINVDANIIHDSAFKAGFTTEKLKEYDLSPENIVFEITEKSAVTDIEAFVTSVCHYQKQHFRIAIDDFGSGYSGLNRVCAFSPQLLKIDMNLIRNIDNDVVKQSAVGAIVQFCRQMNIGVIAEGIETPNELKILIKLGVKYGQGYLWGMPSENFAQISREQEYEIKSLYKKTRPQNAPSSFSKISKLGEKKQTVSLDEKSKNIYESVKKDNSISEFFVVGHDDKICGILTRTHLLERFSGPFGYNLASRTVAQDLMAVNHLCVDETMSVDQVVELAMSRSQQSIYDAIAVVRDGKYICTVTIKDLLLTSISLQVQRAADSNPLTGLPGNNQIQHVIGTTFNKNDAWSIIYLDLDNFKAYNDAYGFSNGDLMLKALAQIIESCCGKSNFCGHIGGDDFVVVAYTHDIAAMCNNICKKFKAEIQSLYTPIDWDHGYITSRNRHGFVENFPIATLSIAAVTNKTIHPGSMEELSEFITATKKKCKQQEGDAVIIV